jgi:hypothetical protein
MSFTLSDYPTRAQERHARIHNIVLDAQYCPGCDKRHPEGYRSVGCSHRGCEAVGCHECLLKCDLHNGSDLFCELHVNDVSGMAGCLACERLDLDAEDFIEHVRRAA